MLTNTDTTHDTFYVLYVPIMFWYPLRRDRTDKAGQHFRGNNMRLAFFRKTPTVVGTCSALLNSGLSELKIWLNLAHSSVIDYALFKIVGS